MLCYSNNDAAVKANFNSLDMLFSFKAVPFKYDTPSISGVNYNYSASLFFCPLCMFRCPAQTCTHTVLLWHVCILYKNLTHTTTKDIWTLTLHASQVIAPKWNPEDTSPQMVHAGILALL